MIHRSIVVTPAALTDYLRKNWRGLGTKDYELLTALVVARVHAEQFGNQLISFPVKYGTDKKVDLENTPEVLSRVLLSHRDEATPIDMALIAENAIKSQPGDKIGKVKAKAFQLKRFGIGRDDDLTDSLISFLSISIPKKYAPVQAALVLMIGDGEKPNKLDPAEVTKRFKPAKYPFERVYFTFGSRKGAIYFGEFWPDFGCSEFWFEKLM